MAHHIWLNAGSWWDGTTAVIHYKLGYLGCSCGTLLPLLIIKQGHEDNKMKAKSYSQVPDSVLVVENRILECQYKLCQYLTMTMEQFGVLHAGTTISSEMHQVVRASSPVNLSGKFFSIVGVHIPPLMVMRDRKPISGVIYNIFKEASSHFNFTYNLIGGTEGTGRKLANGTWTGMVGDLMYRRYDISASIRVTPQRYGLIDEANYLTQDPPVFITSLPQLYVPSAAILLPFKPHMWASIFTSFLIIFALLVVLFTLNRHNMNVRAAILNAKQYFWSAFLIPFSLTMDQGTHIPRVSRLVCASWLVFMIVINTGYKEKLFSFLTFPQPELVPRTIEELHARRDYKIVFHYWKSALYNLFVTSDHEMHKDLVKRFVLEPDILKCVLRAVFEPKTVCIAFQSLAQLTLVSNVTLQPGFQSVVFSANILLMDPMYIGIALVKDSPYTRDISKVSSMFRDGGFIHHWQKEEFSKFELQGRNWMEHNKVSYAYRKLAKMIDDNSAGVKPLKRDQFAVIFGALVLGYITAFLTFLCEKRANFVHLLRKFVKIGHISGRSS